MRGTQPPKAQNDPSGVTTAEIVAKETGVSAATVFYAKGYGLEAEKKMGEMLDHTKRAKGA